MHQANEREIGVDMATDKAGMGDKYDSKISDQVEKQYDNVSESGHRSLL